MNLPFRAEAAYSSNKKVVTTGRGAEYQAFASATHRLSAAIEGGSFPELAGALEQNRKLWSVLADDVLKGGNGLPEQLRAQIFNLAEFTRRHTHRVLSKTATAAPLVEINTAVMRGLRGRKGPVP
ncbi:MAG: flagellar biosynthesis regulator FlaF [Paracoccaceae bacterium]